MWLDLFTCVTQTLGLSSKYYVCPLRATGLIHVCGMTHSMCVTWLFHAGVYDMTFSRSWQDPFTRVMLNFFLNRGVPPVCDMAHSHVWRDLVTCAIWLIHMCDMTHSPLCETNLIHACDLTHTHVWHDLFSMRARVASCALGAHIWMSHVTHDSLPCVWRDAFICVCDVTHSYLCPYALPCVTWLILICHVTLSHACDMAQSYVCV